MSKHEDIVRYILSLEAGTRISVRNIASELGVSDGTAYRAIKHSADLGIVTTIPRVGTVRIEKVEKKNIEKLTYAEVINIVNGSLLGGKNGIHKILHHFVISAMTTDTMKKYIEKDCLVITGNREEVQKLAILNHAGVLITGGFNCSSEIKELANKKCLPIISTSYDTFTVASMINKAISQNLIKKDIVLVEDIMRSNPCYLKATDTVLVWRKLIKQAKYKVYPVVDNEKRIVGIVTSKDLPNDDLDNDPVSKLMRKDPVIVKPKTTVAYVAHIMDLEGMELVPVANYKKLVGVITKRDVIKALHYMLRQPQSGETLEDLILKRFQVQIRDNKFCFMGRITPEMLNDIGTASWSALNMLLSTMAIVSLRQKNNTSMLAVDSINTYFMKPVQIDSQVEIYVNMIDEGKNYCKVEANMFNDKKHIAGKCIVSVRIIRK
ncbi:DRTGG domain-containing protein [Clostridium sp. WILCCON 0269]|uniref:DRTGG domain-containing protein n=1 Tax=Candidatus Clostridium eludens TaxID=3381663 RepID=A0ABW8SJ48_9CLOT